MKIAIPVAALAVVGYVALTLFIATALVNELTDSEVTG